jgi:hypothetical protein
MEESRYLSKYMLYRSWKNFLIPYQWQWFVTLTSLDRGRAKSWYCIGQLRPVKKCSNFELMPIAYLKLFQKWQMEIINQEKLQLGIYLISCIKRERWHAHALMIGQNQDGKTLDDCNRRYWNDQYPYYSKIKNVHNCAGAVDYLAGHFLPSKSDYADIHHYNSRLLRRVKGKNS